MKIVAALILFFLLSGCNMPPRADPWNEPNPEQAK